MEDPIDMRPACSTPEPVSAPSPHPAFKRLRPITWTFGLEEPMPRLAYLLLVAGLVVLTLALGGPEHWFGRTEGLRRAIERVLDPSRWRFPDLYPRLAAPASWLLVLFSARRAMDARYPGWIGVLALVPWLQPVVVLALAVLPRRRDVAGRVRMYLGVGLGWAALHAAVFALLLSRWLPFLTPRLPFIGNALASVGVFVAVLFGTVRSSERRANVRRTLGYDVVFGLLAALTLPALFIGFFLRFLQWPTFEVAAIGAAAALGLLLFLVRPWVDGGTP